MPRLECRALSALGLVKHRLGQPAEALALHAQAIELSAQLHIRHTHCRCRLDQAQTLLELARTPEARAELDAVLDTASQHGYRLIESHAQRLLSSAADAL